MFKYFIALMLLASACQNGHKADYEVQAELQMIDTLQFRLQTVKSWIDKIRLEELQERKDIINHNLEYIESQYVEKGYLLDQETGLLVDEYKSYSKMYKRAADSFKPIVMELEELFIQLKTLKESAYSKDYEKATFLKYFAKEKEDVLKLYDYASTVQKPVIETDLAFERAEGKIEAIAELLKNGQAPVSSNIKVK